MRDSLPKKDKDEFYENVVTFFNTMVGKLAVVHDALVFNPTTFVNCRELSLLKKPKSLLQHLMLL